MEKRTRILLGRSVKRRDAKIKVRGAFEAARNDPQGKGVVELEEVRDSVGVVDFCTHAP